MNSLLGKGRALVLVSMFAVAAGASGCKDDPPPPKPDTPSAALPPPPPRAKGPMRPPMGPIARMDPAMMKEYRIDVCYYGTLSLKQARDAYLASMGKDEPSEKKIPSFGVPKDGAPPATPSTSAAAKPAAPPDGSSSSPVRPPSPTPRFDFAIRAPHERNARACAAAATLKEPAEPGVDEALAAWAPFAVDLAKDIGAANTYYSKEEYKKDAFAQGKALHKKLVDSFAKVDELSDKLGAAIAAWKKDHPADASKMDEGEKLARDPFDASRLMLLAVTATKRDVEGFKANEAKLSSANDLLKSFGASHATDPWAKSMTGPFDAYLKTSKDLEPKLGDKVLDGELYLALINGFISIIESHQRAVSRVMMSKNAPLAPVAGSVPAVAPPTSPAPPPQ